MKIAFVGKMGSGKSSCGLYMKFKNRRFFITNFAKKLKEICKEMYGMVEKDRNLLQTVGDAMRSVDKDVFANYVVKECKYKRYCVVDDARFPNELDLIKKDGWILVKLEISEETQRKRLEKKYGVEKAAEHLKNIGHHSESYIDDYDSQIFDYVIDANQSTEYVQNELDKIIKNVEEQRKKANKIIDKWFKENGFTQQIYIVGIRRIIECYSAPDYLIETIRKNWGLVETKNGEEQYRRV